MAVHESIEYEDIENLYLDPMNPRLGRHQMSPDTKQGDLLENMLNWTLDELAWSYLESGSFWVHEALIVAKEQLYGEERLVVIEGNRRLAALKLLYDASAGNPISKKWKEMVESSTIPEKLFTDVPYMLADTRSDAESFIGFRHVTGIKQWDADEKAGFIAHLIDKQGMNYQQVARKIGSKTPAVRKHYIAWRVLLQIEDTIAEFEPSLADKRFAPHYMSLNTVGVQKYLGISPASEPYELRPPVSQENVERLRNYTKWIFGTETEPPIVRDTRKVSSFGTILESEEAVDHLVSARRPNFEVAFRLAGGDERQILENIEEAALNIEQALTRVHAFRSSSDIRTAVKRLGEDAWQLLNIFPSIKAEILKEGN